MNDMRLDEFYEPEEVAILKREGESTSTHLAKAGGRKED